MPNPVENTLVKLAFSGIAKGDVFMIHIVTGKSAFEGSNWYEFFRVAALTEDDGIPAVHLLQLSTAVEIEREAGEDGEFIQGNQKALKELASTNFITATFNSLGRLMIKGNEAEPYAFDSDRVFCFKVRKRSSVLRHSKTGSYINFVSHSDLL